MIIGHKVTRSQSHKVKARRIFTSLPYVLISMFCVLCAAQAQPVSSTELINNSKQYDGQAVTYEGEVIGDMMSRGQFSWVNANDGQNAIGCWVAGNLLNDISYSGSYKTKGDWIEVSGVFQRACAEHGGDLDIHAQSIRKLKSGRQIYRLSFWLYLKLPV